MLSVYVSMILTIITVAAGIIGTLASPKRLMRFFILGIITVSGVANLYRYVATVEQSPAPLEFDDAMLDAVREVAQKNGYYLLGQISRDHEDLLFMFAPKGSDKPQIGAILPIDKVLDRDLKRAFASKRNLKPLISAATFMSDVISDKQDQQQELFMENLAFVGSVLLRNDFPDNHDRVSSRIDFDSNKITVSFENEPHHKIELDPDFIKRIRPMRRGERYAEAYHEFERQALRN